MPKTRYRAIILVGDGVIEGVYLIPEVVMNEEGMALVHEYANRAGFQVHNLIPELLRIPEDLIATLRADYPWECHCNYLNDSADKHCEGCGEAYEEAAPGRR